MRYFSQLSSFAPLVLAGLAAASPLLRCKRAPPSSKGVIVQAFEWSWDAVAAECTAFLGPAGYGYVQVSPPQEHIQGYIPSQWWTDYQPVSYILTSKRGNRSQFANMIQTCHRAGVKVIADTIWNHMAGLDSGTGVVASAFTHFNYPGIYQDQDFHHCGLTSGDDIENYASRAQVQSCELVNLADLNTGSDYVRGRLAHYGNDLLSLGVDGLRLDAAKHIATGDISNIISRLSGSPYITQEVIYGAGEAVQPSEYTANGDVQEFRYTYDLKRMFTSDGIQYLQNFGESWGYVPSNAANVFVANHDTERNGASLNYNSPNNAYVLAHVFSLSWPYGTPTVLSSYSFSSTDAGAPNGAGGSCSGNGGSGGWLCQHRWLAISGMVGFRNTVGTAAVTNWVAPTLQRIAYGRGSAGFVAINNQNEAWTGTFTTSLPAGTYCEVISGTSNGACTGSRIVVNTGGTFSATIPSRDAVVIHIGSKV